ncbi:hypothetical protein HDU90_006254 [Geranomyces variabilis]|nr:hypothetical protein HDU90_006254 [Geranomyces variabilis]
MATATIADHRQIARALRQATAATPDRDLLAVEWAAVPAPATTTITTNAAGDEEEVEEEIIGQWQAGWRSLRVAAIRLARQIEKHQLAAGDIAALGAIIEAPAEDWSAVLAELEPRIGKDAAEAVRRAAAAARAASGPAPMEL